ncbi:MAG: histone deacetylase [Candidatus Bathyarchaeota archaeon]|nr:histone deacetylase [Candidatus Bathyarchaeota archaeon]
MQDKVAMTFHEKFRQYDLGEGHPYRGDRFINAMNFFKEQSLLSLPSLTVVAPKPASKEALLRVHDEDYVNLIFRLASEGKPYDIETPVSPQILEAALLIVGGALKCGETVYSGQAKRGVSLGGGFHHAGRNYGGGFCLFNDIAVLIEYLRAEKGVEKFLVLDYDVHAGNGTSDIYYRDPTVLFISVHQDPRTLYPGTGFTWQTGEGEGKGFNVNVPLPPRTGDTSYLYAVKEVFVPLAEEFKPEIIIANGGSDSHFADALGDLSLTAKGFFALSSLIRGTADEVCNGKLIMLVGSGYNPKVLPLCWYALIAGAVGLQNFDLKEPYTPPVEPSFVRKKVENIIEELKGLLKEKWSCFR